MKNVIDLVPQKLVVKPNYMLMEKYKGLYYKTNDSSNLIIDMLSILFTDHGSDTKWFLSHLNNPESRGITGSLSDVTIQGSKVILQPSSTLTDDPEEDAVEIDRDELIRLAHEWQKCVDKKVPFIYIYCQNNKYFVSEALPEGIV